MSGLNKLPKNGKDLITLALVVMLSLMIIGSFSKTLRTETTIELTEFTLPAENSTGILTGYDYVQDLSGCFNSTNATSTLTKGTDYTITEYDVNNGNQGKITLLYAAKNYAAKDINCTTLTYLADTDNQARADNFTTGLGTFADFSVVLILAIVGLVIFALMKKNN